MQRGVSFARIGVADAREVRRREPGQGTGLAHREPGRQRPRLSAAPLEVVGKAVLGLEAAIAALLRERIGPIGAPTVRKTVDRDLVLAGRGNGGGIALGAFDFPFSLARGLEGPVMPVAVVYVAGLCNGIHDPAKLLGGGRRSGKKQRRDRQDPDKPSGPVPHCRPPFGEWGIRASERIHFGSKRNGRRRGASSTGAAAERGASPSSPARSILLTGVVTIDNIRHEP